MQALCCSEAGWAQMGKYDHDSRNSGAFLILKPNSTIHHISREVIGETEGGEQDTWKLKPVSNSSGDQNEKPFIAYYLNALSGMDIKGVLLGVNLPSFQSLSQLWLLLWRMQICPKVPPPLFCLTNMLDSYQSKLLVQEWFLRVPVFLNHPCLCSFHVGPICFWFPFS